MHVLKFGGSSLGNAIRILQCRNIAIDRCRKTPTLIVVSAISEVTNILADSMQAVKNGGDPKKYVRLFYERHLPIIGELFRGNNNLHKNLDRICDQYLSMLQEIQFLNHCPDSLSAKILSLGEIFSAKIFFKLLKRHFDSAKLLNSANYIKTKNCFLEGVPLIDEIKGNFLKVKNNPSSLMVMSGFFGSNMKNEITLLGRNSSDYSAALAAYALDAERCEIWTDVDGVFTADPRIDQNAHLIPQMSYQEAMELAYSGATVLHPKTITPLAQLNIPLWIKNSLNIQAIGTKVSHESIHAHPLRKQIIHIFLLGPGAVGQQLLEQIRQRKNKLLQEGIDIKVCYIANSKYSVFEKDGIDLISWKLTLEQSKQTMQINDVLHYVNHEKLMNAVLVDCTSSDMAAENYLEFFKSRMHIVAANKKANTRIATYYKALRECASQHQRRFLYETNVGAGLPIIDTLQNLLKSGDELLHFSGILSGSLSYIFGLLEENIPFSQAIHMAHQNNFTEPDPRDDLSGLDVARKLLILYREAGGYAELHDVSIQSIFPNDFDSSGTVNVFLNKAKHLDDYFQKQMVSLKDQGKVLRLIGEIHSGQCCVRLAEIGSEHPMFSIKSGENAFAFYTKRYSPIPLVVKGYGAGTGVTAAGVFADILRILHSKGVQDAN